VFDGGRVMPLNTYAILAVQDICGEANPTLTLNEDILTQLESGEPINIPSFDDFIAGENYSESEKAKMKQWYDDMVRKIVADQLVIAQKLRTFFPNGERRFTSCELLFSWLTEPELWDYIPFLKDDKKKVSELVLKLTQNTIPAGRARLAPAQIDKNSDYNRILQNILKRGQQTFSSRELAEIEGEKDKAVAELERRYSRFRAIAFVPGREASPMVEYYLNQVLYPADEGKLSGNSGEISSYSLIEQLDFSVQRLLYYRGQISQKAFQSPLDDSGFMLRKTVAAGGSSSREVLALTRQLLLLSRLYRDQPLDKNVELFDKLFDSVQDVYHQMLKHRDELFEQDREEGAGEPENGLVGNGDTSSRETAETDPQKKALQEYRKELLRTVYLLERIRCNVGFAYLALTDNGVYRVAKVPDAMRIQEMPGREQGIVVAVPAATLSLSEDGTMKILPHIPGLDLENGENSRNPWLSIQTILYAPKTMIKRFVNPDLDLTSPQASEGSKTAKNASSSGNTEGQKGDDEVVHPEAKQETEQSPDSRTLEGATLRLLKSAADDYPMGFRTEFYQMAAQSPVWRGASPEFAGALAKWRKALAEVSVSTGVKTSEYPTKMGKIRAEYFYYRLNPFYWMWLFCAVSLVFLLVSQGMRWFSSLMTGKTGKLSKTGTGMPESATRKSKPSVETGTATELPAPENESFSISKSGGALSANLERLTFGAGLAFLILSCAVTFWGGAIRAYITGWAPVTNMFETVVLLAFFISLFTVVYVLLPFLTRNRDDFDRKFKLRKIFLIAGTTMSLLVGMLAYYNTAEFNPNIRPLVAVLRSNFWLTIHVFAIIISYALGAIAWFLAMLMLTSYIFGRYGEEGADRHDRDGKIAEEKKNRRRPSDPVLCDRLFPVVLGLIRSSVLFLTLGIILGALWADFSWGRFWSWDPKEVWALVTLMIYLVVLHGRRIILGGQFGLTIGAVLGMLAIIMTWYGLSFVFGGGGRHAYVAGESSKTVVLYLLILGNVLWSLLVTIRYSLQKYGCWRKDRN